MGYRIWPAPPGMPPQKHPLARMLFLADKITANHQDIRWTHRHSPPAPAGAGVLGWHRLQGFAKSAHPWLSSARSSGAEDLKVFLVTTKFTKWSRLPLETRISKSRKSTARKLARFELSIWDIYVSDFELRISSFVQAA